ncbi:SDR family NAD(P)-dependent oxidoreductase [Phytoactinopolyspora halotolerans]|uniref:SDR family NAD(P)-dependent oxidoreductase n=1 Tax=Phytoactinopolyspora halotolerans TaxID=1981512 RepID=A0A6L9S0U4_9ACTN|nr:SDR family NAD(P)-dependent oxidoreductase [Phytoactinopolyspora halotolerans]NED98548.1 SDR family NAD(P)-dependent oxidoreductase [Phytoactinopolyspora halotolerans]
MIIASGPRVWLITGASHGLGLAFAQAALDAGDRVVAVSRTMDEASELFPGSQDRVLPLAVDVTDRAAVFTAVDKAVAQFGRLDVVVNNAGNMWLGAIEEFTETEARAQMEVNLFGALWVSQAVVPQLRRQGSGHIIQVSSIAGLGGFSTTGMYSASKFALEGMSEALAAEVKRFGISLTIVQPGGYWTDLYTSMQTTSPNAAYSEMRKELEQQFSEGSVDSPPELAARAIMTLVDSDDPPLRLLLGSMVYDVAFDVTKQRMATWARWEQVSRAAERAIPQP